MCGWAWKIGLKQKIHFIDGYITATLLLIYTDKVAIYKWPGLFFQTRDYGVSIRPCHMRLLIDSSLSSSVV